MECKSLAEVELRDATYPLNRSVPSNFLPTLRTAAQLRELVALSVIDPSLSKVIVLSGKVVGCCLVERASDGATCRRWESSPWRSSAVVAECSSTR
jgi:hypothetical protein